MYCILSGPIVIDLVDNTQWPLLKCVVRMSCAHLPGHTVYHLSESSVSQCVVPALYTVSWVSFQEVKRAFVNACM